MKTKSLTFMLIFAVFLSIAMVAAAELSVTSPASLTMPGMSTSYTISNTNTSRDVTVNIGSISQMTDGAGNNFTLSQSQSGNVVIPNGTSITVTIANSSSVPSGFSLGTFSQSYSISNVDNPTENYSRSVSFLNSFCEYGNIDNGSRYLEITRIKDKSSDDEWEWRPLDEVEIEVKVKFNSDDDDDDIDAVIEIGLWDTAENEWVDLDEDDEDLERDISLDEGDSVTEKFTINIPVDIGDGNDYRFYVKTYEEGDEEVICRDYEDNDYYQEVKIEKESYDVIIHDIDLSADTVPCGQELQVNAKIYNIGEHDEEKIYVTLKSPSLGLNMDSEVFELEEGDEDFKRVYFNFIVPQNVSEGSYTLEMMTHFRYRDSTDVYLEHSDAVLSTITIEGNCLGSEVRDASIAAELSSETPEARAGKPLVVDVVIKNTGNAETTYTVSVSGNSLWSEVESVDPATFTLSAGESKEVEVEFDVDDDAEGEKEFVIKADYGTSYVEQKVVVDIEEGFSSSAVMDHLKENWFIYVIVLVNVLLIILIIVVARRIARRPVAA